MSLRWISLSICGLILISGSAPALAQSCSTIRSQMGASASASNAETMQKQRQIAAIRALERQRSCTPEKAASGGLFNACRGLARQRADAESELAAARRSERSASLQARFQALGCDSTKQQRTSEADRRSGSDVYARNALYYCVRPSDGYHFPAPNSQFGGPNYAKSAIDQCRFICENPAMTVYVLENPQLETSEMLSVETRTPYKDLATAFRYQTDPGQNSCNWSRYFARINELKSRAVSTTDLTSSIIPVPSLRPANGASQALAFEEPNPPPNIDRVVRIVGPVFLQDSEGEFRAKTQLDKER
ncbi:MULTISPECIES: DUF2865 domain-containing protein [unclassified Rhizobium]|uniref:DUF2865 domain-containing protein n=1 Tax=unclassified Rhizobium TaxID=2613769 RepID=UPI00247A17C6|nr:MULTISPECIES: DUF2865 domain-containing protein [unclassified Rhizobium]MDH7804115.1 hypothetical protein [Rhizobium sp. AN70]